MSEPPENPFQSPQTVDDPPVVAEGEGESLKADYIFLVWFPSLVVTLSEVIFYEARVPGAYLAMSLSGCGLFVMLYPRPWAWRVALGLHALECVYLGAVSLWLWWVDYPTAIYLLLCSGLSGAIVYWLTLPIMKAFYYRTTT